MANRNPSQKFEKGNSWGQRNGAPAGKRIQKSKLRKLAEKLREREDIALAIVDRSLNEQEVGSETVSTAKWVLNSIVSIEKAAHQEEVGYTKLRKELAEDAKEEGEQTPSQIESEMPKRLSLVYVSPEDDE